MMLFAMGDVSAGISPMPNHCLGGEAEPVTWPCASTAGPLMLGYGVDDWTVSVIMA